LGFILAWLKLHFHAAGKYTTELQRKIKSWVPNKSFRKMIPLFTTRFFYFSRRGFFAIADYDMRCTAQDNLHVEREREREREEKKRKTDAFCCALSQRGYIWKRKYVHKTSFECERLSTAGRITGAVDAEWELCLYSFAAELFLVLISNKMRRRFALIKQTHQTRQYSIGRQRFCFCSPAFHQNFF
jgi:hypothetical protein